MENQSKTHPCKHTKVDIHMLIGGVSMTVHMDLNSCISIWLIPHTCIQYEQMYYVSYICIYQGTNTCV